MPLLSWQDAIGQAAHSADAVCCGRGCVRHDGRVEHGRCSAGRAHDSSCFESDGTTWPERAGWKERKELHEHQQKATAQQEYEELFYDARMRLCIEEIDILASMLENDDAAVSQ